MCFLFFFFGFLRVFSVVFGVSLWFFAWSLLGKTRRGGLEASRSEVTAMAQAVLAIGRVTGVFETTMRSCFFCLKKNPWVLLFKLRHI